MFTQWSFELFLVSGPAVSTVQAVARDSAALQVSLLQLDAELTRLSASFLAGPRLSRLDCEVLPKLHHLRVAADYLKAAASNIHTQTLVCRLDGYSPLTELPQVLSIIPQDFSIPAGLTGIWRYLHAGYNQPIFRQVQTAHWARRRKLFLSFSGL